MFELFKTDQTSNFYYDKAVELKPNSLLIIQVQHFIQQTEFQSFEAI